MFANVASLALFVMGITLLASFSFCNLKEPTMSGDPRIQSEDERVSPIQPDERREPDQAGRVAPPPPKPTGDKSK